MSRRSRILLSSILTLVLLALAGCSAIPMSKVSSELPPVLDQDELLRPYVKLGRIQIVREVYFTDYWLEPNLQQWGLKSLREEAQRMGADALILPEITSRAITVVLFPAFPATEYRATGTAIKFK